MAKLDSIKSRLAMLDSRTAKPPARTWEGRKASELFQGFCQTPE
ncbi:hypothetical protein FHU13_002266 [Methylobacterium sp. R2-1]|nr:hypothetical protein [Methylobacterium sp. R2-1]